MVGWVVVQKTETAMQRKRVLVGDRFMAVLYSSNNPQEAAQHHIQHRPVALHKVAQPFRHRQHPLTHRQIWQYKVR